MTEEIALTRGSQTTLRRLLLSVWLFPRLGTLRDRSPFRYSLMNWGHDPLK